MDKLIKRLLISVALFLLPFLVTSFTRYYFNIHGELDPESASFIACIGLIFAILYFTFPRY